MSAGDGAKGPRWYHWQWLPLADPVDSQWRRWLLVRRRMSAPTEMTAYGVFAPQATALAEVVRVAGSRWTMESGFEAATGEVGLDDYEVRSWTGWYRPITLVMWADTLLAVLRAGAIAVEARTKSPLPPRRGAVWPRSKPGVASHAAERSGDSPASLARGPRGPADSPLHSGLVPLAAWASGERSILSLQVSRSSGGGVGCVIGELPL